MKLMPFVTGLVLAAAISIVGGSPAHAQSQTNNKTQTTSAPDTTVVVQSGDTLDGIATAHQTTYVRMFDANSNIQDPNLIYPDEQLRVPKADEQLTDRALPNDAAVPVNEPSTAQPAGQTATATVPVVQSAPVSGCGDNSYANFIYSHESGCRTTAMSPNGCYGIGQACPASKIAYCGADYACQNAYFTAYAGKYGGWAGAYAFWVAHGWW